MPVSEFKRLRQAISLAVCGGKIGILPIRRLQSVTSSWVWIEWTTYRFSAGLAHTRATHFLQRACVLIPWMNTAQSLETGFSAHKRWMTLSLGVFFKERFHLERFSTWPTELDCMSVSLSLTQVQIAFYSMGESAQIPVKQKWHWYLVSSVIRSTSTITILIAVYTFNTNLISFMTSPHNGRRLRIICVSPGMKK